MEAWPITIIHFVMPTNPLVKARYTILANNSILMVIQMFLKVSFTSTKYEFSVICRLHLSAHHYYYFPLRRCRLVVSSQFCQGAPAGFFKQFGQPTAYSGRGYSEPM